MKKKIIIKLISFLILNLIIFINLNPIIIYSDTPDETEMEIKLNNNNISIDILTSIENNVYDSINDDKKYSLVLTLPNNFPNGSYLIIGNSKYYMNNNKQYVISLADAQETNINMNNLYINILDRLYPNESCSYILDVKLYSSTSNGFSPFDGYIIYSNNISYTIPGKNRLSLKINDVNKKVIRTKDLSESINITLNANINNNNLKCYLMKKEGSGYITLSNVISNVNSNSNHNKGVFDIISNNGVNNLNIKLSKYTDSGTYRLVFFVVDEDDNVLEKTNYNFIVV